MADKPAHAAAATAQIAGRTARAIAGSIEAQIRDGLLRPGTRLPTIRGLADDLGVSPMTVASAYRELRRRGLVTSAGRRGKRGSGGAPLSQAAKPGGPGGARP